MKLRDPTLWMWGEALDMLERADRLQRQFFQLGAARHATPTWEPPVDIFETSHQLIVMVALPGVSAEQLLVEFDDNAIIVRGQRRLPDAACSAHIHRLELPFGRFERRIELPARQLQVAARRFEDGCLTLSLAKPEP